MCMFFGDKVLIVIVGWVLIFFVIVLLEVEVLIFFIFK